MKTKNQLRKEYKKRSNSKKPHQNIPHNFPTLNKNPTSTNDAPATIKLKYTKYIAQIITKSKNAQKFLNNFAQSIFENNTENTFSTPTLIKLFEHLTRTELKKLGITKEMQKTLSKACSDLNYATDFITLSDSSIQYPIDHDMAKVITTIENDNSLLSQFAKIMYPYEYTRWQQHLDRKRKDQGYVDHHDFAYDFVFYHILPIFFDVIADTFNKAGFTVNYKPNTTYIIIS